jgi:hypothetical protein
LFSTKKTNQQREYIEASNRAIKNDNVISLEKPVENEDLLTGMLRQGARELITKAVQAELTEFLSQ